MQCALSSHLLGNDTEFKRDYDYMAGISANASNSFHLKLLAILHRLRELCKH